MKIPRPRQPGRPLVATAAFEFQQLLLPVQPAQRRRAVLQAARLAALEIGQTTLITLLRDQRHHSRIGEP